MPTPVTSSTAMPRPSPAARAIGAVGALAASTLSLGLLMLMFHGAGPAHWFPADAEVLAAEAQCRAASGRPAGYRCIEAVMARRAEAVRLAGVGPVAHGR
jgi:hypothetical protein